MSDRTPVQLIVADCPIDQVAAVLDLVKRFGLHVEYITDDQPVDGQLGLGVTYMDTEVVCGSAFTMARQLQQTAPDASWEVWEDPAYEWLGDLYRFTPELGLFTAECNSQGDPVFTDEQVLRLFDEHPTRDRLESRLGGTHAAVLRNRLDDNAGVVLTPDHPESGKRVLSHGRPPRALSGHEVGARVVS